jgi:hypothetical protein
VGRTAGGTAATRRGGGGGCLGRVGGGDEEPTTGRLVEADPVAMSFWTADPAAEAPLEPGGMGRRQGQAMEMLGRAGLRGGAVGGRRHGSEVAAGRGAAVEAGGGGEEGARGGRQCVLEEG